jgi:hypothetical protein
MEETKDKFENTEYLQEEEFDDETENPGGYPN